MENRENEQDPTAPLQKLKVVCDTAAKLRELTSTPFIPQIQLLSTPGHCAVSSERYASPVEGFTIAIRPR